uniref:G protein alpha subunit n=1 Tax=Plectus sambesii TaxID=2011161 RepID=A0A914XE36_9BILA
MQAKSIIFQHAEIIRDFVKNGEPFPPFLNEIFVALKNLWMDAGIQECYKRRNEYILNESAKFFLDTIDRISRDDYIPNNQDMLYARVPTSSIVEIKFIIKGITFRVFDVGGQRTERRKWIHCFDNVNAIIFMSAMSEYDQFLAEDKNMNRMKESLSIFKQIVNNKVFPDVCAMILFLNKKDLFAEKIKRTSIKTAFSNYQGSNGYEEQASYVSERFLAKNTNPKKQIYLHFTCATDTNQVQVVLDSVVDIMMRKNVTNAGLLS